MDRWAAADLLREAITDRFGPVQAGAAAGLKLRHDSGSCFRSGHYQAEIDHLGIDRGPAFHYEPETNGIVEKFIQTLKEQVLWIERFDTLEQLRARVRQFAADYNEHWLLERHGYRSPRQAREALRQTAMARSPRSPTKCPVKRGGAVSRAMSGATSDRGEHASHELLDGGGAHHVLTVGRRGDLYAEPALPRPPEGDLQRDGRDAPHQCQVVAEPRLEVERDDVVASRPQPQRPDGAPRVRRA